MTNKKFWLGMLVLAFGMVVIGCPTTEAGAEDSWSNVTSLSQLNGTWKGSYAETVYVKEQSVAKRCGKRRGMG